jgi:flagellar motor switch protein FliM
MSGTENESTGQADEDLAAAWGAATDIEAKSYDEATVQPARVLNQAEIDSLLGFGDGPENGENRTGMERIISSGLVSYERLPMLEIVFDRLVRIMSTSLRNFTSDNVEVSIDNILSLRFGDYLNSIPLPAMLAVFKAEEWDNYGLMVVDSTLIYSIVDVLLGGRRGTAAMRIEGRPYTTIERTLVERLIHVVLADLSVSFDPLCPVTFRFERLEVNPRFATISRLSNAAVLARLRIDMEDRGGRLELLLPYATLEPVRDLLLQQFMGAPTVVHCCSLERQCWHVDQRVLSKGHIGSANGNRGGSWQYGLDKLTKGMDTWSLQVERFQITARSEDL